MASAHAKRLLTINMGSSSLKAAVYLLGQEERLDLAAHIERIGQPDGHTRITDAHGASLCDEQRNLPDHVAGLQWFFAWLQHARPNLHLEAVGHRVVHGGSAFHEPQIITAALITALENLQAIDPDHLPQALGAMQAVSRSYPAVPQVACFDTAFHRDMPPVAQQYALPRRLWDMGIVRYGFHGLSYEYIMRELRTLDRGATEGRVIIAHLGNGASMAAVRGGRSVETTMGFTPTGGLVMGTRSGDLDPGVLLYLLQAQGMAPADVSRLVNQQAGLRGVSETTGDMRELLSKETSDPRAADAIALFCYQAKKYLGALAAALGGLDTLVFTGGIGERAAPVRWRICANLEFLGIHLDTLRNEAHASVISADASPVTVRVLRTDEDVMIARHTARVLWQQGATRVPV